MGNELWPAADERRDGAAFAWLAEHDLAPDPEAPVGIDVDSLLLGALVVDGEIAGRAADAGRAGADLMQRVVEPAWPSPPTPSTWWPPATSPRRTT